MEQISVNQRLNLIVDTFEKGKKASFARKVGISPQGVQEMLTGRKGDPSFKVLIKILESYPQVCTEWLVLGLEPMLKLDLVKGQVATQPSPKSVMGLNAEASILMEELARMNSIYKMLNDVYHGLNGEIVEAYKYIDSELPENEWAVKWLARITSFLDNIPGKIEAEIRVVKDDIKQLHSRLADIHNGIAEILATDNYP